jgi:hypothetical protein
MSGEDDVAAGSPERDLRFPWFVCGLMTGVALTLMLTPVAGRDTRRWIVQTGSATRRRTAAVLERNRQAMAVIRKHGVLGLARQRARSRREAAGQRPEHEQAAAPGGGPMTP